MSKQVEFYATEESKTAIRNILNHVYGTLVNVPYYKSDFSVFDENTTDEALYLAEKNRVNDISYRFTDYYDPPRNVEVVDDIKSPVLQYHVSFKNLDNEFCTRRFYCRSK